MRSHLRAISRKSCAGDDLSGDLPFFDFCDHGMSDPPNIRSAFAGGTILFGATAYSCGGTYALLKGYHQPFRYAFFTALNVGAAGGLFMGISSDDPHS